MRLLLFLLCLQFLSAISTGQSINIIPQPASIKQPRIAANFTINANTVIVQEGSNLQNSISFLNDYLQRFYSLKLKVVKTSTSINAIRLNFERLDNPIAGAYQMNVDNKGIYIAGDNETGVFYGIQTLIQLLPVPEIKPKSLAAKLAIPYVSIEDAPRFDYRGLHLDVARHFMPLDFIKKYIDYLALHKMNTFHWHLTDDQGWRIEIKKYPKLVKIGAWRNGTLMGRYPGSGNDNKKDGGFYTQQQIKEIVKYAAARYVTVIPEIELPGHASAAIAAYPELSCFPDEKTVMSQNMMSKESIQQQAEGKIKLVQETWGVITDVFCPGKDSTFVFLQNVMNEVLALFPSKYIHVGGDECPKENWKRCPNCQQRMKNENLKDEHQLQSYFIQRIEKYLNSKGRNIIGWDEILEGGLAPNATVMSWRGVEGGIDAAKQNHDVIMTPGRPVYFDYSQSENEDSITIGGYNPIEKVYAYDPVPKELNAQQAKHILGAQANLWTEYMSNTAKVEYMLFPRIAALSEILWSSNEKKNWSDFETRLMTQFKRYDLWKVNYSKAYFDLKASVFPSDNKGVLWKLESKSKTGVINYNKELEITDPPNPPAFYSYTAPVLITKSGKYSGWSTENGVTMQNLIKQTFHFNKATGKKITLTNEPSKNYPGDGAFTLVNGIQNEKGLVRSKEFLGFSGINCEAIIDLGVDSSFSEIIIHTLEQTGSWIYFPSAFDISKSSDGINFSPLNTPVEISKTSEKNRATIKLSTPVTARYLKINIMNAGTIPAGNPGAGSRAWLFVDEIEIN